MTRGVRINRNWSSLAEAGVYVVSFFNVFRHCYIWLTLLRPGMGVLKSIQPGEYHVTVVAPDTFNHFTPLLPSAAVGTVNVRSLVESIRKVC